MAAHPTELRATLRQAVERVAAVAGWKAAERLEERVNRMSSTALVQWGEQAITGLSRAYSDWQNGAAALGSDPLGEARVAAASLCAVLDELETRRAAGAL
jgi:hypothetical protein